MKKYTMLINELFSTIKPVLPVNTHPYTAFSEGPVKAEILSSQENAVFQSNQAYKNIRRWMKGWITVA